MSRRVSIEDVTKRFDRFTAVDRVSLDIGEGEFITLLGPSGCGKTTLLRMIISVDEGIIRFNDEVMNHIPPHRRNIGMVFQNYAIFPHMSVFDNVAYGLRARGTGSAETRRRVDEVLKLIRIEEYSQRSPSRLSGGQQQRVALARAIVIRPAILLMDEPLSNLDAKLRIEMRSVIRDIQRKLNITTVYVTHDQEEALAVSDRIAVMNHGRIQQTGTPREIYGRPRNGFVAGFIGVTTMLDGEACRGDGGEWRIRLAEGGELTVVLRSARAGAVKVAVKPGEARIVDPARARIRGELLDATFLGDSVHCLVRLGGGGTIEVKESASPTVRVPAAGSTVGIAIDESRVNVFSADGEEALS